jgi:hypothetical protein
MICSRFWTEKAASTPSQRSDILDRAVQRARIRLQVLLRVSSIVSVQLSFAMAARICDGPRRWNTVLVDWHFGLALIFLKTGLTCCILVSHCAVCATYELVKVGNRKSCGSAVHVPDSPASESLDKFVG